MINGKKIVAIIPARGGSKRIPGKNIKKLSGKPLIAWSIKAGLESKYVDDVIVSTDDLEIAKISVKYGADVPFTRPEYLSTDSATSIDVIHHAINSLKDSGRCYDYIVLLQPTSPLRSALHVDKAVQLLFEKNASSITSVCELGHPVEWCAKLPEDNCMDNFISENISNMQSQEFSTKYLINGAIYLVNLSSFVKENSLVSRSGSYALIMDRLESIDIDHDIDFLTAECYMSFNLNN
jgi:CMP-N-acetylneuraminic acid synthetase